MDSLKLLKEGAGQLSICLNEAQLEALMRYLKELKDHNEHFRLVGSVEEEVVVVEHFLDSLSCLTSGLINGGKKVIDIGAGAGFPGLVLKIIRPEMTLTLLDSSNKKATFLQHMVDVLHLSRTEVVCARAEEFGREKQRETYDLALARALAPLPVLLEYALPLLKVGGFLIAQKSKKIWGEIEIAQRAMVCLGGKIRDVKSVEVPFLSAERYLVIAEKTATTPLKYPRRTGIPAKRPL